MNPQKTILYTEAAKKRLESLQADLNRQIEDELRERRFVPGDEQVEVTAADVDELARSMRVRFYTRDESRLYFRDLLMKVYTLVGLLMAFMGICYPYIRSKIVDNPPQITLVATGVLTAAAGFLMSAYFRRRERWMREFHSLAERRRRDDAHCEGTVLYSRSVGTLESSQPIERDAQQMK